MQARTLPHIAFRPDGFAIVNKQTGPLTIATEWGFVAARLFARGNNFLKISPHARALQIDFMTRLGFADTATLRERINAMLDLIPAPQVKWIREQSDLHDMPVVELAFFIHAELKNSGGDFTSLESMFPLDENARAACVSLYRLVAIELALLRLVKQKNPA